MSRTKKINFTKTVIFITNRDKLIKLLLNKITFLDMLFYKIQSVDNRKKIKFALEALENLLKIQKHCNPNLSNIDFESIKSFVDQTIRNMTCNLK